MRHGTKYGYESGCRCAPCRAAKLAARRLVRARGRAANSPAYQRELAASRARKESYRGTCEECGGPTTGCDGPGNRYPLCMKCSNRKISAARRGSGPVEQAVLALLAKGPARMIEVAEHVGITSQHASNVLHRLRVYGHVERISRGVYRATNKATERTAA